MNSALVAVLLEKWFSKASKQQILAIFLMFEGYC